MLPFYIFCNYYPPIHQMLFTYFRYMKQLLSLILLFTTYTSIAQPTWQQRVDSKIEVTLDDTHHFLNAFEELTYTNNSPDTLRYIYIHLWPNAYKNDHTPFAKQQDQNHSTTFYYSKAIDRGYIDSLQFSVNGHIVEHYITEAAPDITRIDLPEPLLPGKTIKIATPFRVKIPKVFSRLGHTGQAYYISQWFPKPAVYDQKGWHPISYLDKGEFYSEYGSYDVQITIPSNYVLMATGNCLDEKENKWLDELSKATLPTKRYIFTKQIHDTIPQSSSEMKTLHFHEDNVHDFAWFADKRWLVLKDTVVSPGNNEIVTVWAAFMPGYASQWKKATDDLKETIKYYGKWVGPYQYKTMKAVLGDMHAGGGMEYPTITIIDKSIGGKLEKVIIHEGGHNWFYGMLGSNERDHAWMDEGINTFYEQKTSKALNPTGPDDSKPGLNEITLFFENAATHNDQASDQTAANFNKINYGLDVYYKTAMSLRWLEKYMGPGNFEKGMKDYYNTWHFHHPYPEDFEKCMQKYCDKSIHWFTATLLTSDKKIDYTITKANINGGNTEVTVRDNTGINAPVLIDAYGYDSLLTGKWTEPFVHTTTLSLPGTDWDELEIDSVIPDAKSTNDVYRRRGLFHHFGVKAQPFFGLNRGEKDKVFFSAALGNNYYDGFMAGILLHDLSFPENRFRFAFAPMYSFRTQSMVGAGSIGYVWYPGNVFKEIMLQADGKTFHDEETFVNVPEQLYARYAKIAPSLTFTFNEHNALSPVTRTLTLKGYSISEEHIISDATTSKLASQQKAYGSMRYTHENTRTYNPFGYSLEAHGGEDFAKLMAEANVRIDYNVKNKSLYVRGFLGKFFAISGDPSVYSRYELNASYSGIDDYLFDGTYIGRNATSRLPAQQISMQEGGFKVPVFNNTGRSDNWMATINLETDLPKIRGIRLFFDAGLIPNATPSFAHAGSTTTLYDGGISVSLVKNIVSVYVPLIMSDCFQNYLTNSFGRKNVFTRSISFTLQFQNMNWLRAPSTLVRTIVR